MTKKAKRFLITGGAGFIGSEIVRQLLDAGHFVRVADNLSKKDFRVDKRAEFMKVDLTNFRATEKVFAGIDICINSAAKIGGIGYFHKYPAYILSENNKIYSSTYEAAVKAKIKRMVCISSSMVFESTSKFPSQESDIIKIPPPASAYGFSKLIGEWYCRSFWDQYRLPYSICRPFNAYGVNEYPEREVGYAHVIPDLVRKILEGMYPLEILGDGKQIRCFTHVRDVAGGIVAVALHPDGKNEDFNVGSDEGIKMIDLAKRVWELMGKESPFKVKYVPAFRYDVRKRIPNVNKIHRRIGWKQKVKFDDGLKEVITWLREEKKRGRI